MIYAWKPRNVDDIDSESHALWLTTAPPADGSEGQCLPDNDLEENPNYSALLCKQYVDYVSKYPGVFESLAGVFEEDLPPPQPSDLGELPAATIAAVASLISVDSPKVSTYDSSGTAPHESPSHPSSVPPSAPNLGTSYADNRVCTYCGKIVDRPTRARDCRNRHLGLTPHKCQGRCGVVGWSAKSSHCVKYVLKS